MHPIVATLPTPWGAFPIYSYGLLLGISLLVGWFVVLGLGDRDGLDRDVLASAFLTTVLGGFASARLLFVASEPTGASLGHVFALREGGLLATGGFLGGLAASAAYLRWTRTPFLRAGDVAAPALAGGLALTAIGRWLYGSDFGVPLGPDAPAWLRALGTFPRWPDGRGSPAWAHHVAAYELPSTSEASLPVHPTQLYEALVGLVLLGVTLAIWRRRAFYGEALLALAALWGFAHFLLEFLRDTPAATRTLGLSTPQLVALVLVPSACVAFVRERRRASGERPWRLGEPPRGEPSRA